MKTQRGMYQSKVNSSLAATQRHGHRGDNCKKNYLTIRPVALTGPFMSWAIGPWPLRAKGLIVLALPNQSDRKGNNKVSKCKWKKYLFGKKKTKEKPANFATQ